MGQQDTTGAAQQTAAPIPFVGRAEELARLDSLLSTGAAGAVIIGGRGTGKTRLGAELLRKASDAGLPVVRVAGTGAAAGIPLGAFASALPDPPDPGEPSATQLRRYADRLAALSDRTRPVILVDDAHLLDDASAALVLQLVLSGRVFVVATTLEGDSGSDAVVALAGDELVEAINLGPLQPDDTEQFLVALLGGPVDAVAHDELAATAEGDLVCLRELACGAVSDGSLRRQGDLWLLVAPLRPSPGLAGHVEGHLAGLSPEERSVLELVAFAEPLGAAEIEAFTDAGVVEQLERRGLLTGTFNGRRLEMRVGRRVHAAVLRSGLPVVRRQAWARSLADLVEARGSRRAGDVLRDATWRLEGGGADHELLMTAALSARDQHDHQLAERLARAAAGEGGGFRARLLATQMAELQGRVHEAGAAFATLVADAGDDTERGLLAVARVTHLLYKVADFDAGLAAAESALAEITDQAWRDEVTALTTGPLMLREGLQAAADLLTPMLERSQGRTLATVSLYATISLGRLGRLSEAAEASRRGYEAHRQVPDTVDIEPATHIMYRCDALSHAGRFDESRSLAQQLHREALAEREPQAQAFLAWTLARSVGDQGHVRFAERHAREAIAIFLELGRVSFVQGSTVYLGYSLALAGRAQEAAEVLNSPHAPDFESPLISSAVDLLLAWAWTSVGAGDLARARRYLDSALAVGQRIGDVVGESVALHTQVRLGQAKVALPRLEELATVIDGDLAPARAAHARALVRRDPEALETTSATFATLGADLLAAEAAADASVAWRRAGDPRRATAAERLARILVARCEGVTTPALRGLGSQAQLTQAERDAATLAAAGKTNREIAAALHLSVRTVENQLQRVYTKLGVSSRSELAGVMAEEI